MTIDQELQLFENIGSIKSGIDSLNDKLQIHTSQDHEQFTKMTGTVGALDVKVTQIIKDMAVTDGVRAEHEKTMSAVANRRATILGSVAGFISSAFLTWLQFHFGGK